MKSKDYIKSRIKQRGLTQAQVSDEMGFSFLSGLNKALSNPQRMRADQVIQLASILKVSPHKLFSRILKG
mgnify:CR=1 FL=1